MLAEGAAIGKPVTIHVERVNPAQRLYRRLGFTLLEDRGMYLLLEWRPPGFPARSGGATAEAARHEAD